MTITDRYLAALGLERGAPCLALLRSITTRHVARIPFASVGVWLGLDLPLDPESIFRRVVVERRGGYCFELNRLLHHVLDELGFAPTLCLARVMVDRPGPTPLTHRTMVVDCAGLSYLVDGGFGHQGPRQPIAIAGTVHSERERSFRIDALPTGEFQLQSATDGALQPLYRFALGRVGEVDCELGHFYSHRHPRAHFVNNLVVSRLLADEIRSLRNRDYWVTDARGRRHRTVDDAAGLRSLLDQELDIGISAAESLALFERLALREPGA